MVKINEIRIDQGDTDNDEYFELTGAASSSLDGLTYLVIGDGSGGSGTVEAVVSLTGEALDDNGFFVAAENTYSLGIANLTTELNFENSDNVTHLLVQNFTGSNGDDLDTNDDGVFDVTPWTTIVDSVALVESFGSGELTYSSKTVGPDGSFVPAHVFRNPDETGAFTIGGFSLGADDTPGAANSGNDSLSLSAVSNSFAEDGSSVITVTRTGDTTDSLVVSLSSNDVNEATVPADVTIPAGQTSATFTATGVDDAVADGDQAVTITATSPGFSGGTTALTITDINGSGEAIAIINEVHADPEGTILGDANGDGARDFSDDEFVEIVNVSGAPLDLSGVTLADGASTRHIFPSGTVLADQQAIIVFGGGSPTGDFGGAIVQTASTGALGLNNGGDTVTLTLDSVDIAYPLL